jgi:hypothetical protein
MSFLLILSVKCHSLTTLPIFVDIITTGTLGKLTFTRAQKKKRKKILKNI